MHLDQGSSVGLRAGVHTLDQVPEAAPAAVPAPVTLVVADTHAASTGAAWDASFAVVLDGKPGGAQDTFTVRVHPEWAPEGAKRFRELLEAKALEGARFFRVVPDFMVQFGIPGDPEVAKVWRSRSITDDPVKQSNKRGTVTFATSGKNARTSQIFINYANNGFLDGQGFSPFAEVVQGMDVVDQIESKYREKPDQGQIQTNGNAYLAQSFPDLSFISSLVEGSVEGQHQPQHAHQEQQHEPEHATQSQTANNGNKITWKLNEGKSCQGYANGDSASRSLQESKVACATNPVCVAIECNAGSVTSCTLREHNSLVDYAAADCYEQQEINEFGAVLSAKVHPDYQSLLKHYPFQQVMTQTGQQVNVLLVRSAMSSAQRKLYEKYKNEILFIGISSMNDYPLDAGKPTEFCTLFPAFLHMMREPEKCFPPTVKTLLMSQSDFQLPATQPRDYSVPKKYDFTYSASDCDVASDGKGWCGWSKNWSMAKAALEPMCSEYNLTGVLVATKDKANRKAYSIPKSCKGKMIQTTYLANQQDYFEYLKNSRFAFLPQVHDASPRVSTQALAFDVPILMNYYIQGGWKYVDEKSGEFFHDMSDFRRSLETILRKSKVEAGYEPRKWVLDHHGNANSGKRLLEFVQTHFSNRVKLPKGTTLLLI